MVMLRLKTDQNFEQADHILGRNIFGGLNSRSRIRLPTISTEQITRILTLLCHLGQLHVELVFDTRLFQ